MNHLQVSFMTASAYYDALVAAVPKARKRIAINAMALQWGPRCEVLLPSLLSAAKKGVDIHIIGDLYTKFYAQIPKLVRAQGPSWQHIQDIAEQLRQAGIQVTYISKLSYNPYRNRCHTKITVIDNQVFSFGGVNFVDSAFDNHDYMLNIHDAAVADKLYKLVLKLEQDRKEPLEDRQEALDNTSTMLFDGGTPNKSIIYSTACDIVNTAKKVYYVSQCCPSGKLAELLVAKDYECYFIRPSQAEPPSHLDLIWDKFKYGITNRYKGPKYIHAKFILTEDDNGTKHVLSGSNNFSWRGVAYGTKEIALHSTDEKLWQQFYDFMEQEIIRF